MTPTEPKAILPPAVLDEKLTELRRMRGLAIGLLVAMTAAFAATWYFEPRWPWLGYIRAFAEASMVGACADWFAVVALFRHPLGIPIPHTAIVPRNKARIGDAIGKFIDTNFLAPSVVSARLANIDAVGWWAGYLIKPDNAAIVAQRTVGFLAPVVEIMAREPIHAYLRETTRHGLQAVPAAPLAGRVLAVLLESGQLLALAERAIAYVDAALARNDELVRAKVAAQSSWWIPKWVDNRLADRVMSGMRGSLGELHGANHPWRGHFVSFAEELIGQLESDPEMFATGERLKAEILANPAVVTWLDMLWREIEAKLKESLAGDTSFVQSYLENTLPSLARSLTEDDQLRMTFNGWIRRTVEMTVVPHRAEIGAYIADVVRRWDDRTLVGKMELTFGKDLQYIRINGTLVGGLVGLLIHIISELVAAMQHI
jgi:uncharacterized membrane-anchored protein YjiN (DUF445 family)